MEFKPLGKVSALMQKVGFETGYAYDDLVFADNAVFIIQMDKSDASRLMLFINHECEKTEAMRIENKLIQFSGSYGFKTIENKGLFSMAQKEGSEEIDLKFYK